jgi:hypothetical protein
MKKGIIAVAALIAASGLSIGAFLAVKDKDSKENAKKNAELAEIGSFDCIWAEIELLVHSYLGSVTLYQVVVEGLAPALRSGYVFEAIPAKELAAMREAKE